MSLLSPLGTFQTDECSVTRAAPGSRVDGVWVEGATTVTPDVGMSIRPAGGKDIQYVPEGTRVQDVRAVMTAHALQPDDVVSFDDETWRVFAVRPWNVRGARYVRALMARERVGA